MGNAIAQPLYRPVLPQFQPWCLRYLLCLPVPPKPKTGPNPSEISWNLSGPTDSTTGQGSGVWTGTSAAGLRPWPNTRAKLRKADSLLRPGYAKMTSPQRSEWVEGWLMLLRGEAPQPAATADETVTGRAATARTQPAKRHPPSQKPRGKPRPSSPWTPPSPP